MSAIARLVPLVALGGLIAGAAYFDQELSPPPAVDYGTVAVPPMPVVPVGAATNESSSESAGAEASGAEASVAERAGPGPVPDDPDVRWGHEGAAPSPGPGEDAP